MNDTRESNFPGNVDGLWKYLQEQDHRILPQATESISIHQWPQIVPVVGAKNTANILSTKYFSSTIIICATYCSFQ